MIINHTACYLEVLCSSSHVQRCVVDVRLPKASS